VLTWNIHGARDASLSQIASEIRAVDADVVCLNEVRRAHIARLARALGMRAYGAVCRFGPYGNVVLTSQPVASFRRLRFARARRVDRRDASLVTLASGLTVACVHLNLRADERVAHAREFLAALPARAIVAGDFNETSERAAAQQMSERFDDAGAARAHRLRLGAAGRARTAVRGAPDTSVGSSRAGRGS
jgi:endonuclease/exonuclease/phosphatase family metal-dependent hydrolase